MENLDNNIARYLIDRGYKAYWNGAEFWFSKYMTVSIFDIGIWVEPDFESISDLKVSVKLGSTILSCGGIITEDTVELEKCIEEQVKAAKSSIEDLSVRLGEYLMTGM